MKIFWEENDKLIVNNKVKNYVIIMGIVSVLILGPFALLFILIGWYGMKAYVKHENMMRAFAKKNGLEYVKDRNEIKKVLDSLKARLFSVGHSKNVSSLMSGEYKEYPTKLFNYRYTVGSGKNSSTYNFTVCEIEVSKTKFPHIYLKSDKMWHNLSKDRFGMNKDVRINLEDQFEKSFNLYCTHGYEIETLQIFTADLLTYLKEHGNKFSIEFFNNKIYFFYNKRMHKEKDLQEFLTVVQRVLYKTDGLLHRLHDDFDAMHGVYGRD
jgi:hypothetical protein